MNCPATTIAESELQHFSEPNRMPPDRPLAATEKLVPELVAEQAKRQPENVAVVMGSQELTYAELDCRASRLANYLQSLGAGPEVLVGLCLERSPEFVVAALAIMKCGVAYLPMDSTQPAERLRFIVKDAGVPLLVTRAKFGEQFAAVDLKVVALDTDENAIAQQPTASPRVETQADQLAYVIYTSGSTGQPKGVEITQRNLSNLIVWHLRAFAVDSNDRATFQAGVGFDAAVWEVWPALAAGAALYLPYEATRLSAEALRDWFVASQITISFVPTALAEQLIALSWPPETSLRFLLTGADTLHRFPPAGLPFALINNYGPTECTVVATSGIVPPLGESIPSIGAPIEHVAVRLIDGEIYLGGVSVARGYRNRPQLTAEHFVVQDGTRFYRTGDLGRELPNGEIEFLGRRDDQVKIRGYRIELNEINAVLNEQTTVKASVVIAREDSPGEKRLVAYIVATANSRQDEQSLREALRQRLPDYMEPAAFVWMDALPLTPNGKIDRPALPIPSDENSSREKEFVAPRTPVEETLTGIITEVLKVPRVSVHDDFFHLGAHSLLGAQVIARVRHVFGAELRLLDVFDSPTVAELSVKIEEALTRQLGAMSEAEVEAALAAGNGN